MAPSLTTTYPHLVEQAVRLWPVFSPAKLRHKEVVFVESGIVFADPTVFSVFTLPMITGDPAKALTAKNSIVVTNFISTDIASVPLLWVIPLSLYLLTFVLAFARRSLIPLRLLVVLLPVLTIVIVISNLLDGLINARLMIVVNLVYFFIAALTCHQLLANDRPPAIHLTQFYFWLSLGGVLGGVFNALLAPLVFTSVVEYPLVILLACLLLPSTDQTEALRARVKDLLIPAGVLVLLLAIALTFYSIGEAWNSKMLMALAAPVVLLSRKRPVRLALTLGAILLVAGIVTAISDNTLRSDRNFFGVLRVTSDPNDKIHWLFHGSTNHGRQSTEAERRCEALTN
jgi:hypothetical protein